MRFNQAIIDPTSSAVNGDPLVIISGVDTLNALNRALGGGGTVNNRKLTFPKEIAHPVIFQDLAAVWAISNESGVVLVGRASDSASPNDLYVFAAPSGIAGQLMGIGPCMIEWGDSSKIRRTWFYEVWRRESLPVNLRGAVPTLSMGDLLREVKERSDRMKREGGRGGGQRSPMGSALGSFLGASLLSSLMEEQGRVGGTRR